MLDNCHVDWEVPQIIYSTDYRFKSDPILNEPTKTSKQNTSIIIKTIYFQIKLYLQYLKQLKLNENTLVEKHMEVHRSLKF